jgi:hypothetical protein
VSSSADLINSPPARHSRPGDRATITDSQTARSGLYSRNFLELEKSASAVRVHLCH